MFEAVHSTRKHWQYLTSAAAAAAAERLLPPTATLACVVVDTSVGRCMSLRRRSVSTRLEFVAKMERREETLLGPSLINFILVSHSLSLSVWLSLSPSLSLSVSLKQTHAHTLTHTHVLFSVSLTLTLTNAFSNGATLARMHTHSFYVSLPFLSRYSLIIKNWSFYLVHFVLLIIHFFLLLCPFGIFAPNSISLIPIFDHMVALLRVLFFLRIEATRSVVVLCLERMHQLHFLAVKCACKW